MSTKQDPRFFPGSLKLIFDNKGITYLISGIRSWSEKGLFARSKNHSFPVISTFHPVKRTYLEFVYVPSDSLFHLAIGLQNCSYGTFERSITLKILALIIKTKYKSCPYILIAQQRNQERLF